MTNIFNADYLESQILVLKNILFSEVFILSSLGQLTFIVGAFLAALAIRPIIIPWINKLAKWREAEFWVSRLAETMILMSLPVVWILLQWISSLVAEFAGWPHHLLTITVSLLTAWIIIRLTATLIKDKTWSKLISVTAWTIAALNI